jgi:hypothetical protein
MSYARCDQRCRRLQKLLSLNGISGRRGLLTVSESWWAGVSEVLRERGKSVDACVTACEAGDGIGLELIAPVEVALVDGMSDIDNERS